MTTTRWIRGLLGIALLVVASAAVPAGTAATANAQAAGDAVFRPYGGRDGIAAELRQLAADHPGTAEVVTIGRTVRGEDLVALRVTHRPGRTRHGARPASLFMGGQHAREWISVETVRRLARHVVEGDGHDPAITDLVRKTEMWFVPVANPDGYDFSFTPGNRFWRKNLRDNDGDGRITTGDGVDLNRNSATRWGHDDEGSSPFPGGDTYRGPTPASEPETRAVDRLMDEVGFTYFVNYHSAAEALYHGTGWQVSTPSPDDVALDALVGTGPDAESAVPGYDPGLLADLYTSNGELTEHASTAHGTLGVLVETSSCQTASSRDPDDRWVPAECPTAFHFPDDEALIDAEARRNLPLALAAARSVLDPDHPVSVTGLTTPDFVVDDFAVSYGSPQPVAVTARRDQQDRRLRYRIGGGATRTARVAEWEGGERYGGEHDLVYAEFRGEITGTRPGDTVEVWFTAKQGGRSVESERFTYTVAADAPTGRHADDTVLVIASEDTRGVNPVYPAGTTGPRHADDYLAALAATGHDARLWDADTQGTPHPLGVLGHFGTVVWETGDDRLAQDAEDQLTDTFLFGPLPEISVAERQQALTMAVRDHLNEGGKLVLAGDTVQYTGLLGRSLGGIYYGLANFPDRDCAITRDFLTDCLLLSDDFSQYYLGASVRAPSAFPTGVAGTDVTGGSVTFGGPAVAGNPLDEPGAFTITPGGPAAESLGEYVGARNADPLAPVEGDRYAGAQVASVSYQRLGRTVDLRTVTAAEAPRLSLQLSYSLLQSFHHVIVEAAPRGTDDWTTLRDLNGRTSTAPPATCPDGTNLDVHPFLEHYLTRGRPACGSTGSTGAWNAFTGESNGWVPAAFDLSAYAGRQVDVKVSYVTDPNDATTGGGIGVFVDDTRVTAGGRTVDADGFEAGGPGLWAVEGPPPGGPPANQADFTIGGAQFDLHAGVATADTVVLGFGLESIAAPAQRADLLDRLVDRLHRRR